MNDAQPVVLATDFTKTFKDFWGRPRVRAVDTISFAVRPGTVFGLLGPNGSGKSTTIKTLLGLLRPTSGQLTVFGQSPDSVRTKSRIGYLPEASYLYPQLTARETLEFYGRLFDIEANTRRSRVSDLLDMVGLSHTGRQPVGEFSKGMQRRLGIAQCLINDPELIILDEPTSGLDPIGTTQVKELIGLLKRRGKTIILCSHLMADVEDVCDEVVIMFAGRIRASGTLQELLTQTDEWKLSLSKIEPDALERILSLIEKETGSRPATGHEMLELEQLFVDVVRTAQKEGSGSDAMSGASQFNEVASFLKPPGNED